MSAQVLDAFLFGIGTVLCLERDAWSMVKKWLGQVLNEYAPLPPHPDSPFLLVVGYGVLCYKPVGKGTEISRAWPPQARAAFFCVTCLIACFRASLPPCFLASLLPCVLASLLPCFLACLLPCLLASLLPCFLSSFFIVE